MDNIEDKQIDTGIAAETGAAAPATEAPAAEAKDVTAKPAAEKPSMRDLIKASVTDLKEKMPGDKLRAQDGKFAKASANPNPTAATTEVAAKPLDPNNPAAVQAATTQALTAPASWSAEAKAQFASLPPAVQKEAVRLESERTKAVGLAQQESANLKKNYGSLEQSFQAHTARLAVRGETPAQASSRLLAMEAEFDRNPAYVLQELARQKGIDLTRLSNQQPGATDRNDMDPHVLQLEDRLKGIEGQLTAQQQAELKGKERQATSVVDEFTSAKDDKGNLLNPHYAKLDEHKLAQRVLSLRQANPARPMQEVLKEAYEAETWATPTVREELLAAQNLAQDEKRKQDQATKVAAAQQASSGNVRGSATTTAPAAPSIRGIIRNTFESLRSS